MLLSPQKNAFIRIRVRVDVWTLVSKKCNQEKYLIDHNLCGYVSVRHLTIIKISDVWKVVNFIYYRNVFCE